MTVETAHSEKVYSQADLDCAVREAGFAVEPLTQALEKIVALPGHRNPCCPTNPAKQIAREALNGQKATDT